MLVSCLSYSYLNLVYSPTYLHSEQEAIITALKASNRELQARNQSLSNSVSDLQARVSNESSPQSASSKGPSITRLRALLDVDISGVPGSGPHGEATALATVPLKFGSQYRSTMERGM